MIKVKSFSQQNKKKHEANPVDLISPRHVTHLPSSCHPHPHKMTPPKSEKKVKKKSLIWQGKSGRWNRLSPVDIVQSFEEREYFFFLKYSWSRLKKEFSAIMLWCDWKVMSSSGVNKMGGFSPVVVVVVGGKKQTRSDVFLWGFSCLDFLVWLFFEIKRFWRRRKVPNLGLIYVAIINRFKFFFVQLEGYWIGKVSFPDSLSGSQFAIIRQESVLCESQAGWRKKNTRYDVKRWFK